jgi:signal transduction histidine kinase
MGRLVTYLIYIAVLARAIGWNFETFPIPASIWALLAIFGLLLFSERSLTGRFPRYPRFYTFIQSVVVIAMLYIAPTTDFLTMLLMPLSFQAVQFFHDVIGFIWIVGFSLAMLGMILFGLEWQAGLTMLLATSGANTLMGSFAHLLSRTDQNRLKNQQMFFNLQQAYRQLKESSTQVEALSAATARHRMARELHDSLTQTLFSMNLAVQSAQFAMAISPADAQAHLLRLNSLACNAASEVQALTGRVASRLVPPGRLPATLQQLVEERLEQDELHVSLEISGQRSLPAPVEANLYRITQEALNNISRHAGVHTAQVRLCLDEPTARLEILDAGCGFDQGDTRLPRGFGLGGMAERANEINWSLEIKSRPGEGTHVIVEERPS